MEKEEVNDNKHQEVIEESANGLDSVEVRGGQNGRNSRGIGSNDMDAKNGILRLGDQDDTTMQVTEEGVKAATASSAKTNTATADVTTAGPDDYASAPVVGVPNAQKEAKEDTESTDANDSDANAAVSQEEKEEDVSQSGTSIDHQPAY
jgi:hypothetical protein